MRKKSLPAENNYGHTKKLLFILDAIDRFKKNKNEDKVIAICDFGCGNGSAVTQYLIAEDILLYGIDIHEPSLKYAHENFAQKNAVFQQEMPKDIKFDIIIYADFLEHVENPSAVMAEHKKYLSDDGFIIGAVPNGWGGYEIECKLDRFFSIQKNIQRVMSLLNFKKNQSALKQEIPYNHDSGHVVFFTRKSLKRAVENAGFTIAEFSHGSFLCGPISNIFIKNRLLLWNVKIADKLPSWAVSTWYFCLKTYDFD